MLEGYFWSGTKTPDHEKRLRAVQAALEIAKASAGAACANQRTDKVEYDLDYTSKGIGVLADAIQAALEAKNE